MHTTRTLGLALALALVGATLERSAAASPPPADASSQTSADDVVHLQGGGFIHGKLVEYMPGEYVVIVTGGGERKRFEWSEVARVERGDDTARATPAGPFVHIETQGKSGISLQRITGRVAATGGGYTAVGISFLHVCDAPCDLTLDVSGGEFMIAGHVYTPSRPFVLAAGASTYELVVTPRRKTRLVGGYALMIGGILFTSLVATLPLLLDQSPQADAATWAAAGVGGALMIGGGITLMAFSRTKVEVLPR